MLPNHAGPLLLAGSGRDLRESHPSFSLSEKEARQVRPITKHGQEMRVRHPLSEPGVPSCLQSVTARQFLLLEQQLREQLSWGQRELEAAFAYSFVGN